MNLPYIKLFIDFGATVDLLSDAEAGRLLKAILHYANGQEVNLTGQERLVYAMLKSQIDRDAASYQQFCDKQRENGSKGGRPKKPTETQQNPNNPTVISKTQITLNKDKDKEEDEDKEKDKEKDSKRHSVAHRPPTVDEVAEYCREKGYNIDAEHFVSYYESNGWRVGKNPMKDWRAACRTWARNEYSKPAQSKAVAQTSYEQRGYQERQEGELPAWLKEEIEMMGGVAG